MASYFHKVTET